MLVSEGPRRVPDLEPKKGCFSCFIKFVTCSCLLSCMNMNSLIISSCACLSGTIYTPSSFTNPIFKLWVAILGLIRSGEITKSLCDWLPLSWDTESLLILKSSFGELIPWTACKKVRKFECVISPSWLSKR